MEGTYTQTKTNMKEVHVAMEAEIGVMQLQGKECGETGTFAIQEHGTDSPQKPPEGRQHCPYPVSSLLASRTLREYIYVVLSHSVCHIY